MSRCSAYIQTCTHFVTGRPSRIVSVTKHSFSQCVVQRRRQLLRHKNGEMILTEKPRNTRRITCPTASVNHQSHIKRPDILSQVGLRWWEVGTDRLNHCTSQCVTEKWVTSSETWKGSVAHSRVSPGSTGFYGLDVRGILIGFPTQQQIHSFSKMACQLWDTQSLIFNRYSRITSTKSLSFCITTFSASVTNLKDSLPQTRDYSSYLSSSTALRLQKTNWSMRAQLSTLSRLGTLA